MELANKSILITGANRGIGKALVPRRCDEARRASSPEHVPRSNTRTCA